MAAFSGCGDGGGGSGGSGGGGGGGGSVPAKAVIAFSTGLPTGSTEQIGSIDITFELPAGVTLPVPAGDIPVGASGVLNFSGEGARFAALPDTKTASITSNYTPATPTSKATVKLIIITLTNSGQGMNPGEFATLVCDLTPGVTIDLAAIKSTSVLIGNTTGVKLYENPGGITGPASASYKVTLLSGSPATITGASSTGTL